MSGTLNARIQYKRDTTINWNNARGFVPLVGEIIVYNDYKSITKEIDGEEVTRKVETTVGRIIYNQGIPQDHEFQPEAHVPGASHHDHKAQACRHGCGLCQVPAAEKGR